MLAEKVWNILSQIDVTPHVQYMKATQGRPAMRYLPWHRAWSIVKEHFPATVAQHLQDVHHEDGTMEVEVIVRFMDGEDMHSERCRLAVMDNNFRAVQEPNARDINDNRQRCLVKALAFAGLGLNLWSDSDIPVGLQGKPVTDDQAKTINKLVEKSGADIPRFLKWVGADSIEEIAAERFPAAESNLLKLLKAKGADK